MVNAEFYEVELRNCTKCAGILATKTVDPRKGDERVVPKPIATPLRAKPLMLVGQAPGLTEYQTGQPFSDQAGVDIRELFAECGIDEASFIRFVHTSAVC